MKYGIVQTVEDEAAATELEPSAKNQCMRAAWAASYRPIGKPEATSKLTQFGWMLRVWVDVEPRHEVEENTDDYGFA